jgi:hypothetical protein
MKTIAAAVSASLLIGGFVLAQQPPKPAPELQQLKWFEGSWACEGNAPASAFGPAHKTQNALQMKLALDGHWLLGTVDEAKTAENPQPVKGVIQLGYDGGGKRFVMNWVDNFGSFATETSPGWQGDNMVWTGDQNVLGQKMGSRDSFTKKTATEFTHRFELENKGKWDLIVEETCKKK